MAEISRRGTRVPFFPIMAAGAEVLGTEESERKHPFRTLWPLPFWYRFCCIIARVWSVLVWDRSGFKKDSKCPMLVDVAGIKQFSYLRFYEDYIYMRCQGLICMTSPLGTIDVMIGLLRGKHVFFSSSSLRFIWLLVLNCNLCLSNYRYV